MILIQYINNFIDRSNFVYKGVPSARLPIAHSDEWPVPLHPESETGRTVTSVTTTSVEGASVVYDPNYAPSENNLPSLIPQEDLDRIVRMLNLSHNDAMALTSELYSFHVLAPGVKVTAYRNRQDPYMPYFILSEDATYAYCSNIRGLMNEMGIHDYDPNEWRLFIDASKRSLKVVLLYRDSSKKPVPIMYAVGMKETYDTMNLILNCIEYDEHKWRVNCDFKVLSLLSGMQTGYTKHCCVFCKWDSRAKCNQYTKRNWPLRDQLMVGQFNVVREPLIPLPKIMLPDLHIKLGIVKNFIKRLVRVNENAFEYLNNVAFPKLSTEKIREGKLIE